MKYYVLKDGKPVEEPDLLKWSEFFGRENDRRVAREKVGDSEVSTVFLGIDHNFSGVGLPILWETMVFGGKLDQAQDRCAGSKEQAEAMHQRMVGRVKEAA